ncbi:MAG TPA: antitoxin family protein [Fimbriiglobus sp.]|nr:antitoxin family protein [Fimbriiglobus sp.]
MTAVIDAVYRDGVFCPATPPDLPEGTAVRLTVVPAAPTPPAAPRDPAEVFARLKRIAEMPEEPGGDPTITGRDHDRTLYGGPGGVR